MKNKELIEYINEVKKSGSNYGLERTERLLELLGNPHKSLKFIHIAGTNGKGSTSSIIGKILINKGYKVGNFNSPHLEEYEEMIRINEENIPEEKLWELINIIKPHIETLKEEGYSHPTEFEIITCLMLYYFKAEGVDYGVIEVGLGGKEDSTNVITPILTIITSISYDHLNLLGDTLEKIAEHKAGIIKRDIPLVLYPQIKEARKVVLKRVDELGVKVYEVENEDGKFIRVNSGEIKTQQIEIKGINQVYEIALSLLGEHQILNCALGVKAVEVLGKIEGINFSNEEITKPLKNIKWIGRLETLKTSPLVVIDGAHNVEGIRTLSKNIKKYYEYNNLYLVIGILADKQVSEMIECIAPMATEIVALTPNNDRGELALKLKKEIEKVNSKVTSFESYEDGYNYICSKVNKEDLILVTGSIYMIGDMRKIIRSSK